jgi:hypothetical protein
MAAALRVFLGFDPRNYRRTRRALCVVRKPDVSRAPPHRRPTIAAIRRPHRGSTARAVYTADT